MPSVPRLKFLSSPQRRWPPLPEIDRRRTSAQPDFHGSIEGRGSSRRSLVPPEDTSSPSSMAAHGVVNVDLVLG